MSRYLVAYIASAVAFFALDLLWLSIATRRFYRVLIGDLLLDKPHLSVAGLYYVIYIGGIVIFSVGPALNVGSWSTALLLGAILGLIAYGTYDLTNLATLKGWPGVVSFVDIVWGVTVTAAAATLGFLIASKFGV